MRCGNLCLRNDAERSLSKLCAARGTRFMALPSDISVFAPYSAAVIGACRPVDWSPRPLSAKRIQSHELPSAQKDGPLRQTAVPADPSCGSARDRRRPSRESLPERNILDQSRAVITVAAERAAAHPIPATARSEGPIPIVFFAPYTGGLIGRLAGHEAALDKEPERE